MQLFTSSSNANRPSAPDASSWNRPAPSRYPRMCYSMGVFVGFFRLGGSAAWVCINYLAALVCDINRAMLHHRHQWERSAQDRVPYYRGHSRHDQFNFS